MSNTNVNVKQLRYGADDISPNVIVRGFGNMCYSLDIDNLQYEYINNTARAVGIFDWKHFNTYAISYNPDVCREASSLSVQKDISNQLGVPFFIGLCFTKPEDGFDKPGSPAMFVIIPGNKLARKALNKFKKADGKSTNYFTPRRLAYLMNSLRTYPKHNPNFEHLSDEHKEYGMTVRIDSDSLGNA